MNITIIVLNLFLIAGFTMALFDRTLDAAARVSGFFFGIIGAVNIAYAIWHII
jgi:small basic protein